MVISILLALAAALTLVSLASQNRIDHARITGEMDPHLNPFEVNYRNQAGMFGAYLGYLLDVLFGVIEIGSILWLHVVFPASGINRVTTRICGS